MYTIRKATAGAAIGLVVCIAFAAQASPQFSVTLIPPTAEYVRLVASLVNDASTAVIAAEDDQGNINYLIWTPKNGLVPIATPDGSQPTSVNALSDHDVVVGICESGAFYSSPRLGALLISPSDGYAQVMPKGVNDNDVVVGSVVQEGGGLLQPFEWAPAAGMTVIKRQQASEAVAINKHGDMVGNLTERSGSSQAIIWDGSEVTRLGAAMLGFKTQGVAVNDKATALIAAVNEEGNKSYTYIWTAKWGLKPIDPDLPVTVPYAIDDQNEVVGLLSGVGAFFWSRKVGFVQLNTLLVPGSPNLFDLLALSMSATGIISGTAHDDKGQMDAVLLIPTARQ